MVEKKARGANVSIVITIHVGGLGNVQLPCPVSVTLISRYVWICYPQLKKFMEYFIQMDTAEDMNNIVPPS